MATSTGSKMVYRLAEGSAKMVDLLGSKGAHASEMARIGIPVPPGFVITTEASLEYYRLGRQFPIGLWDTVVEHVHALAHDDGLAVLWATHLIDEISDDDVMILHEGRVLADGSLTDVLKKARAEDIAGAFDALTGGGGRGRLSTPGGA